MQYDAALISHHGVLWHSIDSSMWLNKTTGLNMNDIIENILLEV
jgi:hypothetical protein